MKRWNVWQRGTLAAALFLCLLAGCGESEVGSGGAANSAQLPTRPGPFGVGVQQITFTKKSVTVPGQDRVLLTDIWYPAEPGAGPIDPALGGTRGAPRAASAINMPLLMFSHGSCWFPEEARFFTTAMASWGFIVAAPPHPGNLLTDCGTANSFRDRSADIRFVIDSLLQLNADPASFFSGAIDPNRIGMSGHSLGGQTALLVSLQEPRVIAGLALAPLDAGISVAVPRIHIPMMVQAGALDAVLPFDTNAQPIFAALKPPKYLVEILHSGHYAFSDDCYPLNPPDNPCSLTDVGAADVLTQDAAHQLFLRYAVPFLLHWVAGDSRFDAFLAADAATPGVLFTADTGGN